MNIYEKLQVMQLKIKAPKSKFSEYGNYHYRSCDDITEAMKPLEDELKVTSLLSDEIVMIGDRFYVQATVRFINSENPEEQIIVTAYAREELERKQMDASQLAGVASSYARKYALAGLLKLDDGVDSDALPQNEPATNKTSSAKKTNNVAPKFTGKPRNQTEGDEFNRRRKALAAIAEEKNITSDLLNTMISDTFGFKNSSELTFEQLEELTKMVKG